MHESLNRLRTGFWLLLGALLVITGCAQPPVATLEDVRSVVAHAYASGAARYAPGEYQLASSALLAAEQQVEDGDYRKALRTLDLARRYSTEALNITLEHKRILADEQQRLAEQKRLEEQRKEQELAQARERERLRREREIIERRKQASAKVEPVKPAKPTIKKKPVKVVAPAPKLLSKVEVLPGENLAMLAARKEVYSDALLWPLIYRANRDQIKDPKEIFAGQIFVVPRDKNRDDEDSARQEAKDLDLFKE